MARRLAGAVVGHPLVRQAVVPLVTFVGVAIAGVVGFSLLAGVGLVEAAFWLVDPTSIELYFDDHDGREILTKAYAIAVTLGLLVSGLWIGETVLTATFGEQLQERYKSMHTERAIDDLENHVIVCGRGMFGRTVASQFRNRGSDVVVIERDEEHYDKARSEGELAVHGDARRAQTLRSAGIERAETVVTAIDDSNANIQTAIQTRDIAPAVTLVVRVGDELYRPLAERAGADEVVIPEVVSGTRVTDQL